MTDTEIKKDTIGSPQLGTAMPTAPKEEKPAESTQTRASSLSPAPPKKQEKLEGPWMYVGPTLPGVGIQNRVYTQISEEAQNRAEETPEIHLLFIPVKDYPMANRMLREKFGYIYNAYCKAEETRKGGNAQ